MVLERILLQTIKFDLQVEHPYMFLLRYVKQLKGNKDQMFQSQVTNTLLAIGFSREQADMLLLHLRGEE